MHGSLTIQERQEENTWERETLGDLSTEKAVSHPKHSSLHNSIKEQSLPNGVERQVTWHKRHAADNTINESDKLVSIHAN